MVESDASRLREFVRLGQTPTSVEGVSWSRVLVFRTSLRTLKYYIAKTRTIKTFLSFVLMDTFTRSMATIQAIKGSYFFSFISLVKLRNILCGQWLRLNKFRALLTYLMVNLELLFKLSEHMATKNFYCFIVWSIFYAVDNVMYEWRVFYVSLLCYFFHY